jgi:hypothetical protein
MEFFRTHLAIKCAVLGLALIVVGALLVPGGDIYDSLPYQVAAVILAVVIYVVLRRQNQLAT